MPPKAFCRMIPVSAADPRASLDLLISSELGMRLLIEGVIYRQKISTRSYPVPLRGSETKSFRRPWIFRFFS